MARNNSINNTTFFVQFPTNDAAPTPGSGGVLAVNAGHQPYYNNATATYGLPLVNNGGLPPAEGDLLVGDTAGSWDIVTIGADTTVLTSDGTTASWQPAGGAPALATFLCQTNNDLPTNGIDLSAQATWLTLGVAPSSAPIPAAYQSSSLLTYNDGSRNINSYSSFSDYSSVISGGAFNYFTYNHGSGNGNLFYFSTSRGTLASPSAVDNGDILTELRVAGQFGGAFNQRADAASISFKAENDFDVQKEASIIFSTRVAGDGNPVERVKIEKTGHLIGSYGMTTTYMYLYEYLQMGQNSSIPTIGSGLTFGVTTSNLPYAKDSTSTFGIPMILGGSAGSTQGDLQVGNATGTYDVLAIGTSGYLLKSNGTTAAWTAPDYAPIVTGGAADTVGQATIAATTSVVTVNTTAVAAGSRIFVSISGFTGTASLALGPIATGNRVNGTSFDITIATAVPLASTVVVDWFIITP